MTLLENIAALARSFTCVILFDQHYRLGIDTIIFFYLVNEEAEDQKGFTASTQYCSFYFSPLLTRWG